MAVTETGRRVGTQARYSRAAAWTVSILLVALGVLGFVPGVTTDYSELQVGGYESGAMLFGVFQVSIALNVIHLLIGGAGMLMGLSGFTARSYLVIAGLLFLLMATYGALIDRDTSANVLPVNLADVWLHGGLAVVLVICGVLARSREHGDPTAE